MKNYIGMQQLGVFIVACFPRTFLVNSYLRPFGGTNSYLPIESLEAN